MTTSMHDVPELIARDRARQARFQRLYAAEALVTRAWRLWSWCKALAAVIGLLWR